MQMVFAGHGVSRHTSLQEWSLTLQIVNTRLFLADFAMLDVNHRFGRCISKQQLGKKAGGTYPAWIVARSCQAVEFGGGLDRIPLDLWLVAPGVNRPRTTPTASHLVMVHSAHSQDRFENNQVIPTSSTFTNPL